MVHKRRVKGAASAAPARTPVRWRWVCAAAAGVVLLVMLWAAALQRKVHRELSQPAMQEGFGLRLPVLHTGAPGAGTQAAAAEALTAASQVQAVQPAVAAAAAAVAGLLPQPVQVTVTRLDASIWRVERDAVASSSSSSSSSSSRSSAEAVQPAPPLPAALQQHPQSAPLAAPKVALLFLTASTIANEAVWRAFFERAAELQLQPAVAASVTAAAQAAAPDAASLSAALGPGRTLHPDVGVFPPWAYPGYRVQHGLMAGAGGSSTAAAAQKAAAAAGAPTRGSPMPAAAHSPALTFPAAVQARESGLLHAEMQRLLHRRSPPVPSSATPASTSSSRGQQGATWSAYTQLSTLRDALTAAGLPQPAAALNSTVLMAQHAARPVQVDPARCAASLGAAGQPPLFSAFVHTPAGQLLPASSLLSGCELRVRLNTTRGYAQHVLAEAEALLLWAALSDPLNAKFVFVSDSSIPLYVPQVIWSQLMFERHSRLDACITPGRDTQLSSRWRYPMATQWFNTQHWRKSSQWATLQRQHALLAVTDNHVREMLHRYCYTGPHSFPICVSDEHWLPSLLASYGLDSQTDCEGATHYADWSGGGWHPKSFQLQDLTPRLVQLMRSGIPSAVEALAAQQAPPRLATAAHSASQPGARQLQSITHVQADARVVVQQQQQQPLSAAVLAARQQARIATAKAAISAAAEECNAARAIASASAVLSVGGSRQVGDAASSSGKAAGQQAEGPAGLSAALSAAGFEPLGSACPLLARKFIDTPGNATLVMALSCAGLGLGRWC